MGYYLQMDGVDDNVVAPAFPWDTIVMDISINNKNNYTKIIGLNWGFVQSAVLPNYNWDAGVFSNIYVNDVEVVQNTPFMTNDKRVLLSAKRKATNAYITYLFSNTNGGGWMRGIIYSAKFYLAGVLQAHYDMTLGNVQDQSGNGRHATLNGGTWVQVSDSGSNVSYIHTTAQRIYSVVENYNKFSTAQIQTDSQKISLKTSQCMVSSVLYGFDSLQRLYENIYNSSVSLQIHMVSEMTELLLAKQIIFSDSLNLVVATVQSIYKNIINDFTTEQNYYSDFTGHSDRHSLKIVIANNVIEQVPFNQQLYSIQSMSNDIGLEIVKMMINDFSLSQNITSNESLTFKTMQIFVNNELGNYQLLIKILDQNEQIISVTNLYAKRTLSSQIMGKRVLVVTLRGAISK